MAPFHTAFDSCLLLDVIFGISTIARDNERLRTLGSGIYSKQSSQSSRGLELFVTVRRDLVHSRTVGTKSDCVVSYLPAPGNLYFYCFVGYAEQVG